MDIRGLIFDLDGTLLDSLEDLVNAGNATLAHFGFPGHTTEAYRYFVGDGLLTLIQRIIPEQNRSRDEIAACMDIFRQIYGKGWDRVTRPYAGIPEMLQQLRQDKLQLAVLSNKPDAFTRLCVERYFAPDTFAFVYGHREDVPKKPDPTGATEIAALMNLQPQQIVYVGDTATDMQTGSQAGMFTLGVLWGFRERRELEDNGADRIISHPSEIVSYVNNNR
jgi:phosphoglycolate phosphatase